MAKKTSVQTAVVEAQAPVAAAVADAVPETKGGVDWDQVFQYDENELTIEGNLGGNPVAAQTPNGVTVAKFSICNHRDRRLEDGSIAKKKSWFMVRCYGKTAEIALKWLKKGRKVRVKGTLDSFETLDRGEVRTIVLINAREVRFLDSNKPTQEQSQAQDEMAGDPEAFPF